MLIAAVTRSRRRPLLRWASASARAIVEALDRLTRGEAARHRLVRLGRLPAQFHAQRSGITGKLLGCATDRGGRTHEWLAEAVPVGARFLDRACGSAPTSEVLHAAQYVGLDLSRTSCARKGATSAATPTSQRHETRVGPRTSASNGLLRWLGVTASGDSDGPRSCWQVCAPQWCCYSATRGAKVTHSLRTVMASCSK